MNFFFKTQDKTTNIHDKVAKTEILLAGFIAEQQVPFKQVDHLVDVLKNMSPNSKIAESMTLKRSKASYIMQECIAYKEREDLTDICKKQKLSELTDKSTDISAVHILTAVVRFID